MILIYAHMKVKHGFFLSLLVSLVSKTLKKNFPVTFKKLVLELRKFGKITHEKLFEQTIVKQTMSFIFRFPLSAA